MPPNGVPPPPMPPNGVPPSVPPMPQQQQPPPPPPQQQQPNGSSGGGKKGNKGNSSNGNGAAAPAPSAVAVKPVASAGLSNTSGEHNCFLNVAVQGLYHLRPFRRRLLSSDSGAVDAGEPSGAVSRELIEVFSAMDAARPSGPGGPASRKVVAPARLRAALAACGGDAFKLREMSDASEVMHVLYESLHRTFSKKREVADASSADAPPSSKGGLDEYDQMSLAHAELALDVEQYTQCRSCGAVETHLRYAKPFHLVHAQLLRNAKESARSRDTSFGSLLGAVEIQQKQGTDRTCSSCQHLNPVSERVHHAPSCLSLLVCWETQRAPTSDVATVASSLGLELELKEVFDLAPGACGKDGGSTYRLRAVACYAGSHYKAFCWQPMVQASAPAVADDESGESIARKPRILTARRETCATLEDGKWTCFNDDVSTVIGEWSEVVAQMKRESLQPLVLFYERS